MLGQMDSPGHTISFDLYSEHPVKLPEVGDFNVLVKTSLEVLDKVEEAKGNGAVVDMHHDDCELILELVLLVEHGLVNRAPLKAKRVKDGSKLLILVSARLLEAIEGLFQPQHVVTGITWLVTRS